MTKKSNPANVASAVLAHQGSLYAEDAGIRPRNEPGPLFQLLCASILMSARIRSDLAVRGAKALWKKGWRTPRKMAASTWEDRARALNRSGYARYDERTSTMLGETALAVIERYGGDLRQLRSQAGRRPGEERKRLKAFKGIGEVGADIFFREAQAVWPELYPFMDRRAAKGARRLGLRADARKLAGLVGRRQYPRLMAGLVRVTLDGPAPEVDEAASMKKRSSRRRRS